MLYQCVLPELAGQLYGVMRISLRIHMIAETVNVFVCNGVQHGMLSRYSSIKCVVSVWKEEDTQYPYEYISLNVHATQFIFTASEYTVGRAELC